MDLQDKKQIEKYELFLFDLDGTLYFQRGMQLTMGLLLISRIFLGPKGLRQLKVVLSFRKMRENIEDSENADTNIYNALSKKYGMNVSDIKEIIFEWIYDKPLKYIARFSDKRLIGIIKSLVALNKKVAIYSDYETVEKQKALGISDIEGFYGMQEEIKVLKPNPKGIFFIMDKFKIEDKSKVLLVGDRMSKDGQAAINAGVDYMILKKYRFNRSYKQ